MKSMTLWTAVAMIITGKFIAVQAAERELGIGMIHYATPYKSVTSEQFVLPWFSYQGDRFSIHGLEAAYQLNKNQPIRLSARLAPAAGYFDPKKASDPAISALDKRRFSYLAGIELAYQYGDYHTKASLMTDITGTHHGMTSAVTVGRAIQWDTLGLVVVPELSVHYWDSKIGNYYFGISEAESDRTGLRHYQAKGRFRVQSGITLIKATSTNSKLIVSSQFARFIGEHRSEMVDSQSFYTLVAGWAYTF